MCVAYKYNSKVYKDFPASLSVLRKVRPIYEELPGWQEDISEVKRFQDLPQEARRYLKRIERLTGAKIKIVAVGLERDQTIIV